MVMARRVVFAGAWTSERRRLGGPQLWADGRVVVFRNPVLQQQLRRQLPQQLQQPESQLQLWRRCVGLLATLHEVFAGCRNQAGAHRQPPALLLLHISTDV